MKTVISGRTLPLIGRNQVVDSSDSPGHKEGKVIGSGSSIGAILIESGRLSTEDAEHILRLQKDQNRQFGEIAVELGLLTQDDIRFALSRQFDNFYLPEDDNSLSQKLIAAYKPYSPVAERLRALRNQLVLRWLNTDTGARRSALAVVSAGKGEGKSFIAANLAIIFSQLGERTLLVDADLRAPSQHELFKISHTPGLSDLLVGRVNSEAIIRIPLLPGLYVLPAGVIPPSPQELFSRAGFAELLGSLIQDFDTVILDTPSAYEHAETQMIAATTTVLLVSRKNHSSISKISRLIDDLRQIHATVIGSVLNDF